MTPQLTHDVAVRQLRLLVTDIGNRIIFDALDFLLDELTAARKSNGQLIAERDVLRREYAQLVSDNMRDQGRRNQAAVRAVAERGK